MPEQFTSTRLIQELYGCRWARPALSALANAAAPHRQADLIVDLVAASGSLVHHRTLSHAMAYLVRNRLVVRHDERPGLVAYEITRRGRELQAQLEDLERVVDEQHYS